MEKKSYQLDFIEETEANEVMRTVFIQVTDAEGTWHPGDIEDLFEFFHDLWNGHDTISYVSIQERSSQYVIEALMEEA